MTEEGRLAAALMHAGPGAVLSHLTAGWWWKLIVVRPPIVHVSAPGDTGSLPRVRVVHPRRIFRTHHRGFPVTPVPRTLLDLAAVLPYPQLRRAIAEADFRGLLQPASAVRVLGRGRRGSAALRKALDEHLPELAATRSVLEERFLALCEAESIPLPEVYPTICGYVVDALWRRQRLVVELDGQTSHGSPAAIDRDRQRDLTLRAAGYEVRRYSWRQITARRQQVIADLRAALDLDPNAELSGSGPDIAGQIRSVREGRRAARRAS
jgi:hypothetical protein